MSVSVSVRERPATMREKENAAWQSVILAGDAQRPFPVPMIGRETGQAFDKIWTMVARYHAMKRAGIEPVGDWWHDRVNVHLSPDALAA